MSILFELGYNIAELIFSSSHFKCISEDYAVSIILSLANKGLEYLELLKYSFLDFCKSSTIMEVINFFERVENFSGCQHLIAFFKKLISHIKGPNHDSSVKERSLDNDSAVPAVYNEIYGKYSKELGEIRSNHETFCIEMLSIMPKTREYFSKIYKILEYSSKEKLDAVIKYAYENGYCKVLDNSGNDAFLNASKQNNFKLCKKLHLLGFDVNSRCSFGNSVLIWFAIRNNLKAVKYFSNFIDVNAVNCTKGSLLYYATRDGYLDIVEYLCSLPNINVNIVNADGKTPLSIAKSDAMRSILLQHDAKL